MQFACRRYDTAQSVTIHVSHGVIQQVVPLGGASDPASLPWVSPGFVDLQVNGYGGQDFGDPDLNVDDVARVCKALDSSGVTRCCPTVTTHHAQVLQHALRTIAHACRTVPDVAARVIGIHLEGPYISPADGPRGAHPRQHVRPPDWDEFQRLQQAASGQIRILTMSPEYPGSGDFIRRVADSGVLVALGHTNANSVQIKEAADAGARLSTHLGNGSHGQIRRHPNYIWDQLADDRLTASLIVDGHHLPPSVVRVFLRAKTPRRCILISDMTGMAGMPPGRYENSSLGDVEVLADGRLVIAGQRQLLAGASLPLCVGIANVQRFADVDLRTAVDMASTQPAALVGGAPSELREGAAADLTLFRRTGLDGREARGSLEVAATINGGELVYGSLC
jgi:N-acetylglucosamine-6-phosphate deacetylase